MKNNNQTQIIILAAGKGTRMKTEEPKALVKLNQKPFLLHILETINKVNLPLKPIIVIGYKKDKVIETIGKNQNYIEQKEQLGTGHAVMQTKDIIKPDYKTILVLSTDQPIISKESIEKILNTHHKNKAIITLGTVILPDFLDWRAGIKHFGRIIRKRNGEVKKIVEYKDASDKEKAITEVNPAIYAFDSNWLWKNISKLKNENASQEYYLTDLIKIASKQNKKIIAVPIKNILEALQPNSLEELKVLEELLKNK